MGAHQVAKKPRRRKPPAGQFNLRQSSCRAVGFTADQLRKAWANPARAEGPCTTLGRPLVRFPAEGATGAKPAESPQRAPGAESRNHYVELMKRS
jgi:hypothetical protein